MKIKKILAGFTVLAIVIMGVPTNPLTAHAGENPEGDLNQQSEVVLDNDGADTDVSDGQIAIPDEVEPSVGVMVDDESEPVQVMDEPVSEEVGTWSIVSSDAFYYGGVDYSEINQNPVAVVSFTSDLLQDATTYCASKYPGGTSGSTAGTGLSFNDMDHYGCAAASGGVVTFSINLLVGTSNDRYSRVNGEGKLEIHLNAEDYASFTFGDSLYDFDRESTFLSSNDWIEASYNINLTETTISDIGVHSADVNIGFSVNNSIKSKVERVCSAVSIRKVLALKQKYFMGNRGSNSAAPNVCNPEGAVSDDDNSVMQMRLEISYIRLDMKTKITT
jgi:hypothetical protein